MKGLNMSDRLTFYLNSSDINDSPLMSFVPPVMLEDLRQDRVQDRVKGNVSRRSLKDGSFPESREQIFDTNKNKCSVYINVNESSPPSPGDSVGTRDSEEYATSTITKMFILRRWSFTGRTNAVRNTTKGVVIGVVDQS